MYNLGASGVTIGFCSLHFLFEKKKSPLSVTCFGDAQNSQFLQVSCTFDHVFPEQPRVGLLVMDDRWTPAAGDFRNVSSVKNLHSSSHSASAEQKKAIWRHLPSLKLTAKAPKSGFFGIWSFPMGFSSLCSGRIDNCSDDEKNILYIFTCIYIYIYDSNKISKNHQR